MVTDGMEQGQEKVIEDGPQASPVTQLKLEYFQLYSFIISSVATDCRPIDIIDSGAEAPLLSSG